MNCAYDDSIQDAADLPPQVVIPGQPLITNHPTPTDVHHRYIGRIKMIDGSSGTGTLVRVTAGGVHYHVVVTAAHVIYDSQTQQPMAQATFTPAYCPGSAPGTGVNNPAAPYGIFPIGRADMFIAGRYRPSGRSRYDYAALLVRQNLPAALGQAPVLAPPNPAHGQNIEVVGYPGISDGNMAGGTGQMIDNGNGLIVHSVSTGPGSSGAPVMQSADLTAVVAIHVAGSAQTDLNWGPQMSAAVIADIANWAQNA